ncbi:MAG: hypothetical protein N3B01_04865 [Verrucomicrobiae bacterium]|nr:hypothetical protein [Verrucomicrobiae bacterium]
MNPTDRLPMPRERGAWGILLVPFCVAVAVSGSLDLKVLLFLTSTICLFVARASWLERRWQWLAVLLVAGGAAAVPLLAAWGLWWLAGFAMIGAALAALPRAAVLISQLLAVAGLTLTAPAAWYTATGRLDAPAFWLWLWNALYFAGSVCYVRLRIARKGQCWPVLTFYFTVLAFALALAAGNVVSYGVPLAFAPSAIRAILGTRRLSATLRLRRLGWSEMAHAIVFGVLLAAALR